MADSRPEASTDAGGSQSSAVESGSRWRLFVGLPPDVTSRDEITRQLAALQRKADRARWVPAENVHITLLFLGSRDEAEVAAIARAVGDVAAHHAAFQLELGEAGTFGGGRRGRTLWLRVERGTDETAALARDLERALGGDPENAGRDIRPHLTLARDAERSVVERARESFAAQPTIGWSVERIHLYRSRLGHGPPVYEELAVLPLGRRAGPA